MSSMKRDWLQKKLLPLHLAGVSILAYCRSNSISFRDSPAQLRMKGVGGMGIGLEKEVETLNENN
jgi:hypothetical protein